MRPTRHRAARRDRRAGRYREDGGRDRGRPATQLDGQASDRWRLAGPTRDGDDSERRRRRAGRSLERSRRRSCLFERLKGAAPLVILDNCEHVVDSAAALAVRLLDAAPGLRILCTSQVRLGVDGEGVVRAGASSPVRRRRTVHPAGQCAASESRVEHGCGRRHRRLPLARRSAVGDRAGRGTDQDAVDRGDHPAPRRSVSRCSATRPAAGRNAAGRSGRRFAGATSCCSPTTSAASGHLPPSRVVRPCRRSSSFWRRSRCPPPRRSTWSAGSRADHC